MRVLEHSRAGRAVGIARQLDAVEVGAQRVVDEQAARQALTQP